MKWINENVKISNLHKTLRVTKRSYHTQLRHAHIRGDKLQAQLRNIDTSKDEQIRRLTTINTSTIYYKDKRYWGHIKNFND